MRTIMLIKQLLKDSDLSSVSFSLTKSNELLIHTNPEDKDLQNKIQSLLDREIESFFNKVN